MTMVYPAIFHKEDGSYWVEFPDLMGCYTYGTTIQETMEAAQESLGAYLLTLSGGRSWRSPPIFPCSSRRTALRPWSPVKSTCTRTPRR